MSGRISGKKILIFGGSGSLGRALIRRWTGHNNLIVVSRDEAKHWTIRNELNKSGIVEFRVGDIRDKPRVVNIIRELKPDMVIVAAALKQVDTCELSPEESIKTNILGVSNVLEACSESAEILLNLETVLMVSTDKACSPTNVYGMSKAIAERLVVSNSRKNDRLRFLGVRYGNVLDSRGSILPLFKYQAERMQNFTITHKEMTRFLMTLDESIDLIERALLMGSSGDFWVPKLRSMRVADLANIFADRYGKPIVEIGIRPGEKLHEDLISETESLRTRALENSLILTPEYSSEGTSPKTWCYRSNQDLLDEEGLFNFLDGVGVFNKNSSEFMGNSIEEIRTV